MKMTKFLMSSAAMTLACGSVAQAGLIGTPQDHAIWHMETITPNVTDVTLGFTGDAILDSAATGQNWDLLLGTPADFAGGIHQPTVVPGGTSGNALSLDGDDMGYSIIAWQGSGVPPLTEVEVEFDFKEVHQTGSQSMVAAKSTFVVNLGNNSLGFTTWRQSDNLATTISVPLDAPGAWRHVRAFHNSAGRMELWLNGVMVDSADVGEGLRQNFKSMTVGNDEGKVRYFTGLIDEVHVSIPEPASLGLLAAGGLMALGRRRNA